MLLAGARTAAAGPDRGPPCDGAFVASLADVHYAIEPSPDDSLGLELGLRALSFGWGGGCDVRKHQLVIVEGDAPEYSQPERSVIRLGTYRHGWQGPDWTFSVGLRGAVRWGDDWRFATPVVDGSVRIERALLRAELDLGGLSLAGPSLRLSDRRTDLTFEARGVWPVDGRARGELRVRARDRAMPGGGDVHDLTVTAGVGWATASRDGLRALPAFLGLARRSDDRQTTLVVLEWNLGVGIH
ncbi:MAG TPA: hypothetical protein VHE35_26095 [Kofleriaceae bacterium]|nr:hypothetical protein [Kofleriaceae bacterium]